MDSHRNDPALETKRFTLESIAKRSRKGIKSSARTSDHGMKPIAGPIQESGVNSKESSSGSNSTLMWSKDAAKKGKGFKQGAILKSDTFAAKLDSSTHEEMAKDCRRRRLTCNASPLEDNTWHVRPSSLKIPQNCLRDLELFRRRTERARRVFFPGKDTQRVRKSMSAQHHLGFGEDVNDTTPLLLL